MSLELFVLCRERAPVPSSVTPKGPAATEQSWEGLELGGVHSAVIRGDRFIAENARLARRAGFMPREVIAFTGRASAGGWDYVEFELAPAIADQACGAVLTEDGQILHVWKDLSDIDAAVAKASRGEFETLRELEPVYTQNRQQLLHACVLIMNALERDGSEPRLWEFLARALTIGRRERFDDLRERGVLKLVESGSARFPELSILRGVAREFRRFHDEDLAYRTQVTPEIVPDYIERWLHGDPRAGEVIRQRLSSQRWEKETSTLRKSLGDTLVARLLQKPPEHQATLLIRALRELEYREALPLLREHVPHPALKPLIERLVKDLEVAATRVMREREALRAGSPWAGIGF